MIEFDPIRHRYTEDGVVGLFMLTSRCELPIDEMPWPLVGKPAPMHRLPGQAYYDLPIPAFATSFLMKCKTSSCMVDRFKAHRDLNLSRISSWILICNTPIV